jgi:hypothetical protein
MGEARVGRPREGNQVATEGLKGLPHCMCFTNYTVPVLRFLSLGMQVSHFWLMQGR